MSKETIYMYFSHTAAVFLVIALFLHIIVLHFLKTLNRGFTNQRLLIMNLSITELAFIPAGFIYYLRLPGKTPGTLAYELTTLGFSAFAINCYLANALLILDRAVAAILPLKYRSIFSTRRVRIIIVVLWIPFLLTPIPYFKFGYERFISIMIMSCLVLDAVMIIMIVVGYSYVYFTIQKRRRTFRWDQKSHQGIRKQTGRQQSKIFKVAIPVILTFFIFVVLPDVISLILAMKKIDPLYYRKVFYTIPSLDILIDPLLFFYQYPPLRQAFLKKFGFASEQSFLAHSRMSHHERGPTVRTNGTHNSRISSAEINDTGIENGTFKNDVENGIENGITFDIGSSISNNAVHDTKL